MPMKAIACTRYGPPEVLQLVEAQVPVPKRDQVRIKIHATAVTASDIFIRGSEIPLRYRIPMRLMMGVTRPRRPIIGLVLAGEIESVGGDIRRFRPGDRVYGLTGFDLGAYAEYACMRETDSTHGCLAIKPANVSYEAATAAAYGGLLATQYLEQGRLERGQHVLIYGASGTAGTTAVQLAKHLGARVTGVCGPANLELIRSLGADAVIDYTAAQAAPRGERYDLVLDAVGKYKTSPLKKACRKALSAQGTYVSIDDGPLQLRSARLTALKELIEAGHVKAVVDRIFPLERIVDAHRYVAGGHKIGGVAITVGHDDTP
jgi:NADPH:quinone reductase-like Zn-dependent oxidoreductase